MRASSPSVLVRSPKRLVSKRKSKKRMLLPLALHPVPKLPPSERVSLPPVRINAKDYLTNRYVGYVEGKKIYSLIRAGLLEGRKVILSVSGLDVFAGFWDTSICMGYGEFPESTVDGDIEIVDVKEVAMISLENMKRMRKLYYYHHELYEELMRGRDPKLRCDEDEFDEDFVPDEGDPAAPGNLGRWIDHETGEEYFI